MKSRSPFSCLSCFYLCWDRWLQILWTTVMQSDALNAQADVEWRHVARLKSFSNWGRRSCLFFRLWVWL
jgi:hypothetical protein